MRKFQMTKATLLIASDSTADASMVKKLLVTEVEKVFTSTVEEQAVKDFEAYRPDVLVLAFDSLEKAERYYLGLYRLSRIVSAHDHRTIILCHMDELRRAYELCVREYFDDYVLFWPIPHDAVRLPMAVRRACRELNAYLSDEPSLTELIAPVRRLAGLESLLDAQFIRGEKRIDEASRSLAQRGEGNRAAFEKSAEPIRQWVHDFRRESAPLLDLVRSLNSIAERILPTILVVDDDEFQCKVVARLLSSEPYRLVFVSGGIEALTTLRKLRADVVLVDLMMPDITGIEVTRYIKSTQRTAHLPIVMMTGRSEKDLVLECLEAGAMDFVVKPFSRETLVAKLSHAMTKVAENVDNPIMRPVR